jgi:acyl carrier protein
MAATLGNPGQAAYAGANAFLDAFAAWRRARGRPATAIAFGPWEGDGMAARLDERLRARLRQLGVSFVPAATAARLLVQHRDASNDLAVLPVRWAEWLQPFRGVAPKVLVALQPAARPNAPQPRLDLQSVPTGERLPMLRTAVRNQVAAVLGFPDPTSLQTERTFRDFGLDSLLAVDAKDRLERLTGLTLPATLLFDHPDLERLTGHLHAALFPATTAVADADLDSLRAADLAKALADELRSQRDPR